MRFNSHIVDWECGISFRHTASDSVIHASFLCFGLYGFAYSGHFNRWIHALWSLCIFLLSLNITCFKGQHAILCINTSFFFRLNDIPLHGETTFFFFLGLFISEQTLTWFFTLALFRNNAAKNLSVKFLWDTFLISPGHTSGIELWRVLQ